MRLGNDYWDPNQTHRNDVHLEYRSWRESLRVQTSKLSHDVGNWSRF